MTHNQASPATAHHQALPAPATLPAPPAFEARGPGRNPENQAPPAIEARGPGRSPAATLTALATLALLLLGTAACGIRGTSVPVDAGPAPSRVSCEAPSPSPAPDAGSGSAKPSQVRLFLVCSEQIMPVDRSVPAVPARGRAGGLPVARALLEELQSRTTPAEGQAGFSTEVPGDLQVNGPRKGDPGTALRLNRVPDELPPYALAQLVCTYADTASAGGDQAVVLGGPGKDPLERYACTDELRANPESAPTSGTGLK